MPTAWYMLVYILLSGQNEQPQPPLFIFESPSFASTSTLMVNSSNLYARAYHYSADALSTVRDFCPLNALINIFGYNCRSTWLSAPSTL